MAQILVRNLNPKTVTRLKRRAKATMRSVEGEVRSIIEEATEEPKLSPQEAIKELARLRRRFKGRKFTDSVELIREDRDR